MGEITYLKQVTAKMLKKILENKDLLDLIIEAEPNMYERWLEYENRWEDLDSLMKSKLYQGKKRARTILNDDQEYNQTNIDALILEKRGVQMSHLLTECINRKEECLSYVIYGRYSVKTSIDYGFGPPSYLLPEEVMEISMVLQSISDDYIKTNFDPLRFAEWEYSFNPLDTLEVQEKLDDYLFIFNEVKQYYFDSSSSGNAIVHFSL